MLTKHPTVLRVVAARFVMFVLGLLCTCVALRGTAVHAQSQVLPADTSSAFDYFDQFPGGSAVRVPVAGLPVTHGIRIATAGNAAEVYLAQLSWNFTAPVQQNDIVLVTFWLRKIAPLNGQGVEGQLLIESNDPSYTKSMSVSLPNTTSQWRKYVVPARMAQSYAAGAVRATFQFGVGPQTFELAGVSVQRYPPTTNPASLNPSFDYSGSEANAPWRTQAQQRIEQHRKADITIRVVNEQGQPVPGATVSVDTTRLAFKFGTAVNADFIVGTDADSQKYREKFLSLFNASVIENHLKWPFFEEWGRVAGLQALDWLQSNSIPVRGHNLIWPSWDDMPADAQALAPAALRTRIDNHFDDMLELTNGKIYEWDVINEPFDNFDVQGRIGGVAGVTPSNGVLGNNEAVRWFQRARTLAPNTRLVLNDYGIVEGFATTHRNYFIAYVQWLLAQGAPIDAIGLQSHFGSVVLPITQVEQRLNALAALGLPMVVTEFDVPTLDEQLQANYLRDYMTLIFSRPECEGFFLWGFWENAHWEPQAAFFRSDWTIKPNGMMFDTLVNRTWRTRETLTTNAAGEVTLRAFKGSTAIVAKKRNAGKGVMQVDVANGMAPVVVRLGNEPASTQAP